MAGADLSVGLLGGKVRASVSAVPPFGWVGAVALGAVAVLAWHFWDQDEEDRTDWTDPQQPPAVLDPGAMFKSLPTTTQQQPSWNAAALRGRRAGSPLPGAV